MAKMVAILVGLPGSGKTSAGQFFISRNIPVVRMGDLTQKYLNKRKLDQSEKNEKKVREELRTEYGTDIYAREALSKINYFLKSNNLVVVDGMRSPAEWDYFRISLKGAKIIYLEAGKSIREARLRERTQRPLSGAEIKKREEYEINILKIRKLKKIADFVIKNNYDTGKLNMNLNNITEKLIE